MAIAFVGKKEVANAATGTGATVTYAASQGNAVIIGVDFSAVITSPTCVDNGAHPFTNPVVNGNNRIFIGTAASGVTAYTLAWTNAVKYAACLVEYSGNAPTSGVTFPQFSTGTGTSTAPLASLTMADSNSIMVGAFGGGASLTYTAAIGTIRTQITGGAAATSYCIADNFGLGLQGALNTVSAAQASNPWSSIGIEVAPVQPVFGGTTYSWLSKGKAGGMNKHDGR